MAMSTLTLFVPDSIPLSPKDGEDLVLCSESLPDSGSWIFGRDPNCNFVIDYRTVSAHHCSVGYDANLDQWEIADLASTNGTWLNGKRLPPKDKTPLNLEDRFSLGTLWDDFVVVDFPLDTVNEDGETTAILTEQTQEQSQNQQNKTYGDALYEVARWLISGQTLVGKIERVLIVSVVVAVVLIVLAR